MHQMMIHHMNHMIFLKLNYRAVKRKMRNSIPYCYQKRENCQTTYDIFTIKWHFQSYTFHVIIYLHHHSHTTFIYYVTVLYPYIIFFWNATILRPYELDSLEIFNLCWTCLEILTTMWFYSIYMNATCTEKFDLWILLTVRIIHLHFYIHFTCLYIF
jgi:hypothetical protein